MQDFEQLDEALLLHQAQHLPHVFGRDRVTAEREHLVQQRQSVAYPSLRTPGDGKKRVRIGSHAFELHNLRQPLHQVADTYAPEVESLYAGQHGGRALPDLLRLRRGEHEDHAGRWLLQDFQKRVPRLPREHVSLIDDVDLVALLVRGRVHRSLTQVPRVIDPAIARGVDLDHIQRSPAGPDARAGLTRSARLSVLSIRTIERHREDAGGRRLTDSPGPGEQIGVRGAARLDGNTKRRSHVILSDEIGKPTGSVSPGERCSVHVGQATAREAASKAERSCA